MKIAALAGLACSIMAALLALNFLESRFAKRDQRSALQQLDQIASAPGASLEIKKLRADIFLADKQLAVSRHVGTVLVWTSTSLSALSLIFIFLIKKAQPPQTT